MEMTSARRRGAGRMGAFPVGWALIVAGVLLAGYGLWVELFAPVAWSGTPEPTRGEGSAAVYETPEIALEPGTWGVRLSLRPRTGVVEVVVGGARVTVTAPRMPGWEASGRLRISRPRRATARRRARLRGTVVARVPETVRTTLRIEVERAAGAAATVRIVRLRGDFRLPLWGGVGLLVLGVALQPGLRGRLLGGLPRS